jgi:hypothetical protein
VIVEEPLGEAPVLVSDLARGSRSMPKTVEEAENVGASIHVAGRRKRHVSYP